MHVDVITSAEGIESLREAWQQLSRRALRASPFNSWEWQSLWWKHYGAGHPLRILAARDGERTIGILPLYVQPRRVLGAIRVRMLRNVGTGGDTSPDDLDPLVDPDYATEAPRALANAALGLNDWDLVRISDMGDSPDFLAALAQAASGRALHQQCSPAARISYIALPATWDEYLTSLGGDRRYTIRKTRRNFEALPGARFYVWEDRERLDEAVDRLVHLHRARWQNRGEAHAFSTEQYVAFHREVMHAFHERNWLRLHCMELDGQIIAMYYCYRHRDAVYYFQGGFDPSFSNLRPGLVLMGYAIEHAIGEGATVFDMLRGEYEYKTQWAKPARQTMQFEAHRNTLGGLAHRLRTEHLPALKRGLAARFGARQAMTSH